jgi:hypothetical protein
LITVVMMMAIRPVFAGGRYLDRAALDGLLARLAQETGR